MTTELLAKWIAVALISIVWFWCGATIGFSLARDSHRKIAIEYGCAHYDNKTAEFTWNERQPPEAEKP